MQSAPVNFLVLRHLLRVAEVEAHEERQSGVVRQLRMVLAQLNAYGEAAPDEFRVTVELAIDGTVRLSAVKAALEHWAFASATAGTLTTAKKRARQQMAGAYYGKQAKRDATDRQAEWVNEARKMLKRNPRRTPADMARTLAAEPDETASAGWIAKVLRKTL